MARRTRVEGRSTRPHSHWRQTMTTFQSVFLGAALAIGAGSTAFAQSAADSAKSRDLRHDRRDARSDARDIRQDRTEVVGDQKDVASDHRDIRQDSKSLKAA